LGLTLLNALFLEDFMPVSVLQKAAEKYAAKYPFITMILAMLK